MAATPQYIAGLASKLSLMANELANVKDPTTLKFLTSSLVMEAKKVIWQLQDPLDSILEHTINTYTVGAITALLDMGVFDAVPATGTASVKEIAEKCDADEVLIVRLMRQLLCMNIFQEVSHNVYAHNSSSIAFSEHMNVTGKYVYKVTHEEMAPAILHLHDYIRKYGKKDVLTYTETPHSWISNMEGKTFWEVLTSDPKRLDQFNRGLSLFAAMFPVIAIFPYEEKLREGNSPSRPFVVDVGGGHGLALIEFQKGCPSLQGELILQDRQVVLDALTDIDLPNVTKMAHDFFTEQPVKNAQIYYIRRVLHDWQDTEATQILKSIKPAMGPDSRIIVSDMCIPEPVTIQDSHAVWLDLMMLTIGGKERTKRDWAVLAELADLKLVNVWQEPGRYGPLAMVEYMLPDSPS